MLCIHVCIFYIMRVSVTPSTRKSWRWLSLSLLAYTHYGANIYIRASLWKAARVFLTACCDDAAKDSDSTLRWCRYWNHGNLLAALVFTLDTCLSLHPGSRLSSHAEHDYVCLSVWRDAIADQRQVMLIFAHKHTICTWCTWNSVSALHFCQVYVRVYEKLAWI